MSSRLVLDQSNGNDQAESNSRVHAFSLANCCRQSIGFLTYYLSFAFYLIFLPWVDRHETDERFRRRLKKATRLALRAFGVEVKLSGEDRLVKDSHAIIVANHSSWFDQLALIASLDLPIAFVANQKYFKYKGLGRVLRKLGSVAVFQSDVTSSLRECRETLAAGKWLVIYPEGTRSSSLLPFRRGAAVLAEQTGAVIQPVVIRGAREVLSRGRSLFHVRPGVITLDVLPPVASDPSLSTRERMKQIEQCFSEAGSTPPLLPAADARAASDAPVGMPVKRDDPEPGVGDEPDLSELRASDVLGAFYVTFALLMTACSIALSLSPNVWLWLAGQGLLAVTLIQWFAILHEAGHKTLFSTRWLNRPAAHLAGFFALIPGDCWRLVHAKHHYWTGWQDLDVTTETLVPRPLRRTERIVINTCWRLWIPLFASLYRWNNYWNLPRLRNMFPRPRQRRLVTVNILFYAIIYIALAIGLGLDLVLKTVGLGVLITLSLQDLLILSQHTHIPMKIADGKTVKPFTPSEQAVFTRSLIFPRWFARLFLLNVDAHGLHHMLPRIPGYHLHRLQDRETMNCIRWWQWILRAKAVRGEVLLFQNRDQTGFYF